MTENKKPLSPLEAAQIGLRIIELLEPIHSVDAKLSLLEAAQLLCRASDECEATELADGYPYRADDEDEDEDEEAERRRADAIDCELCEQEEDLELGTYTPHEHGK